jgi:hypothetical protein
MAEGNQLTADVILTLSFRSSFERRDLNRQPRPNVYLAGFVQYLYWLIALFGKLITIILVEQSAQ